MISTSDRFDMDEVHQSILRQAQERQRTPNVDMAELTRVASRAYFEARDSANRLEEAEQRAMLALEASSFDSDDMRRRAAAELGEESSQVRKREFAYEFIFAAVVPVIGFGLAGLMLNKSGIHAAWAVYGLLGFVLALATLFAAFGAVKGVRVARFGSVSSVLVHSGGSILAGLCMLGVFGFFAHQDNERDVREAKDASLEKVNQAAVVTLAARMAGADTSTTQAAVSQRTDSNWIKVEASPTSPGPVLLSAELPKKSTAELRIAHTASGAEGLDSFVLDRSGTPVHYANYFTGRVLKADFKEVTIAVTPNKTRIVQLPSGGFPPSLNSEVVVALGANEGGTLLIQPIDSVVAAFKNSAVHN